MGIKTAIQWCDSSCNPAMGCDGCELYPAHCYAKAWCDRWAGHEGYPKRFEKPELFRGRIEKALRWSGLRGADRPAKPWLDGLPRVIFLCDLGDPFAPSLQLIWLAPHVPAMGSSGHVWILLTKWPERFAAFVDWWQMQYCEAWPPNIWGGVSVTSQENAGRIDVLCDIPLAVRLVSFEPLLGPVAAGFSKLERPDPKSDEDPGPSILVPTRRGRLIDWAIFGGESGPGARPCDTAWIRQGVADCRGSGVAPFVKQLGSQQRIKDPKGGDPAEWPEDLRVREMPKTDTRNE